MGKRRLANSCWLFKATAGAINTYATIPQIYSKNSVAIQKLRGEIGAISQGSFDWLLKLDDSAVKLAEKRKYLESIKKFDE